MFNLFYCFVLSYHLIFQYLSIELGMQILFFSFFLFRLVYSKLSDSLDCHFWIGLWYSLTFSYRRLTFFPNCIWNPTYAVNIYGWLMCKLTVPQRIIESKTNMQYIFKIICILQILYTGRKILNG